jgi:hypothetical protein
MNAAATTQTGRRRPSGVCRLRLEFQFVDDTLDARHCARDLLRPFFLLMVLHFTAQIYRRPIDVHVDTSQIYPFLMNQIV